MSYLYDKSDKERKLFLYDLCIFVEERGEMKTQTISIRVDAGALQTLEFIERQTGMARSAAVRNLIEALARYYDRTGTVPAPMEVIAGKGEPRPDFKNGA